MDSGPARRNTYVAYMLRLWQAGSCEGIPVWRASLENPHTGERLVFGDRKGLLAFLADLMGESVDQSNLPLGDQELDEGDLS